MGVLSPVITTERYSDGSTFQGSLSGSKKRHGFGVFELRCGSRYQGEFVEGDIEGWGSFCWVSGERYIGEWRNGVQEGFGVQIYSGEKQWYVGWWVRGKRDGYGMQVFRSGSRYEGMWFKNVRHGFVQFLTADGDCSMCLWDHGKIAQHFASSEEAESSIQPRPALPNIPQNILDQIYSYLALWQN